MDGEKAPTDRPEPVPRRERPDDRPAALDPTEAGHVTCPQEGCRTRFACDACLDEHLRSIHEATYLGIFGDVAPPWVTLCEGHAEFPLDRITTG